MSSSHVESTWNPSTPFHMDSIGIPHGFQVDSMDIPWNIYIPYGFHGHSIWNPGGIWGQGKVLQKVWSKEQNHNTKLSESSQLVVRARTKNLGQQNPTMNLKEGE